MQRRRPTARLDVHGDLAASHHVGHWVRNTLTVDLAVHDERLCAEVELAVHEAWSNIVEHAYSDWDGIVTLTADRDDNDVVFQLFDKGLEFDPQTIPDPEPDGGQVGGYGLSIMRSVMDRIIYDHTPNGNRWQMVKSIN